MTKTWLDMKNFMFTKQKQTDADREVDGMLTLLKIRPGSRILDIPCGIGRHTVPLAQRGFRMSGIDLTPEFLQEARALAESRQVSVDWRHGDMLLFREENTYDVVINLYSSFGFFKNPEDDRRVLQNYFADLKSGGRLFMDLMSREIFQEKFPSRFSQKQDDGSVIDCEFNFTENGSWLEARWVHKGLEKTSEARMELRLYTREELCELLTSVGFRDLEVYGDFDGRPYDKKATHLVIVATRP